MKTKCAFVAMVGLPNSGKSTLINRIVGGKISIVSRKAQTTRFRIIGIKTVEDTQLVFIDTPGIFSSNKRSGGTKKLNRAMVNAAWSAGADADITLLVIDAYKGITPELEEILASLKERDQKTLIALNKVDLISKKETLLHLVQKLSDDGFQTIYMISALDGTGVNELLSSLSEMSPEGPWHYPADQLTTINERLWAAEITREVLLDLVHEEIPYALMVETSQWELFNNGSVKISQTIYVEKDSQKAIILGEKGTKIKQINIQARKSIQTSLGIPVHLFLFVKVDENWKRNKEHYTSWGLDFNAT